MIAKLISKGQSGVDRAALEWGLANGYEIGGYSTRNRRAEDGEIPVRLWPFLEAVCTNFPERTRRNVAAADATLVLWAGSSISPGSRLTVEMAERLRKPHVAVAVPIDAPAALDELGRHVAATIGDWIDAGARSLNVAGTRESKAPGIYRATWDLLTAALPARSGVT
jgi:hypothetical protein